MRAYTWFSLLFLGISGPALAQTNLEQFQSLAKQLDKITNIAAADSGTSGKSAQQIIGIMSQSEQVATDKGPSTPAASVGWNAYTMSACIAFVYGSDQYNLAYFTTGAAFITQSSYAIPILAANCSSGKTFLIYLESDRTTVTAVASYPR